MGRSPAADTTVGEDAFAVPHPWRRKAEPFRGRGPVPSVSADPGAPATVADLIGQAKARLTQAISHPGSDPDLVEAARLQLGTGGRLRRRRLRRTPLGGAVVASLVAPPDGTSLAAIVDGWVLVEGLPFAAEAGALMGAVRVVSAGPPTFEPVVTRASASAPSLGMGTYVLYKAMLNRLRAHVAAASDAEYDVITESLAGLRDGPIEVRIATSYLVPTQQEWVDDDIATAAAGGARSSSVAPLMASVTTAAQAAAVVGACPPRYLLQHPAYLYSLVANVGPPAAPVLARLFDADTDAASNKRLVSFLAQLPSDEAFGLLVERLHAKYVQPAVMDAMNRFPRRAMRMLAVTAARKGANADVARTLLRGHALSHPEVLNEVAATIDRHAAAVLAAASPAAAADGNRETGAVVIAGSAAAGGAGAGDIPAILVSPPWNNRKAAPSPTVIPGVGGASPARLAWKPGEQEKWAATDAGYWWLAAEGGPAHHVDKALRERPGMQIPLFAMAPEDQVRPLLAEANPTHTYGTERALRRILGRFGDDAAAYVLRAVRNHSTSLAPVLLPYEGSEVSAEMAEWYSTSKKLRPLVVSWFDRHGPAAAADLVPVAVGQPGKQRSHAESALRLLASRGHREAVGHAARQLGPAVAEAVDAILARDPLQLLPARMPKLPAWVDPAHLPPVVLRGGGRALPPDAVVNLCAMVAISRPGETYAGIDLVRPALEPQSLAEMAWGLFESWQAAGYPSKENWILNALGLFGDDTTVRRLSPLISAWPGEAAHARAVAALDALSTIGTDVALLHLHATAEKSKFQGLRTKAQDKIEEVAGALGLTTDELADRLVPDFGLDAGGSIVLEYGPRRFRVTFDEQLRPVVTDDDGARRKVLPRPAAKDDPKLAPAAYARYTGLKKDVKTVADDQIRRFEGAMVSGRRWQAAEQRARFVDHPLLWHVARRVVWGVYDGARHGRDAGRLTGSFRVAEDRTLADDKDEELVLPEGSAVGIAHPLHLGDEVAAWSEIFADYELLQPFPQLGREVHRLTDGEKTSSQLARLEGQVVYTGRILALIHRGWERGMPGDGGVQGYVYKLLADSRAVVVQFDPGIVVGEPMHFPEQTVRVVGLHAAPPGEAGGQTGVQFGVLDDVTASEVLRDLHSLIP